MMPTIRALATKPVAPITSKLISTRTISRLLPDSLAFSADVVALLAATCNPRSHGRRKRKAHTLTGRRIVDARYEHICKVRCIVLTGIFADLYVLRLQGPGQLCHGRICPA